MYSLDRLAEQGGRGIPNDEELFHDVVRALEAELAHDDVAFIKTCQLDLDIPNDTTGRIIGQLADWSDCPVDIEVWAGGESGGTQTYRVAYRGDADA